MQLQDLGVEALIGYFLDNSLLADSYFKRKKVTLHRSAICWAIKASGICGPDTPMHKATNHKVQQTYVYLRFWNGS